MEALGLTELVVFQVLVGPDDDRRPDLKQCPDKRRQRVCVGCH